MVEHEQGFPASPLFRYILRMPRGTWFRSVFRSFRPGKCFGGGFDGKIDALRYEIIW